MVLLAKRIRLVIVVPVDVGTIRRLRQFDLRGDLVPEFASSACLLAMAARRDSVTIGQTASRRRGVGAEFKVSKDIQI